MLDLHNVTMELSNVRKKVRKPLNVTKELQTDSSTPADRQLDRCSIASGSIEKAPVSSTAPRQLLDSCIYQGLKLDTSQLIEVTGIQISRSDLGQAYVFVQGFFSQNPRPISGLFQRSSHEKILGAHMQKVTDALFSLKEAIASLRLRVL